MHEVIDQLVAEWVEDNKCDYSQCGIEIHAIDVDDIDDLKNLIVKTVLGHVK